MTRRRLSKGQLDVAIAVAVTGLTGCGATTEADQLEAAQVLEQD